jgi:uncharacterized protein YjbK
MCKHPNKVTYKTLLKLGKFDQFIQPFKHGNDAREAHHYLQVTKKFPIMGNLRDNANILMHLQDQGMVF